MKSIILCRFCKSLLALIFTVCALAAVAIVPENIESARTISAVEVKKILDENARVNDIENRMAVIDVRKLIEFSEGHIPGALHIPYDEKSAKVLNYNSATDSFDHQAAEKLREKTLVFYCNGPECWKSFKAIKWLIKNKSSKKLLWLRGGLPEWRSHGFTTAEGVPDTKK